MLTQMFQDMTGMGEDQAIPVIEKKPSSKAGGKTVRRGKRDWVKDAIERLMNIIICVRSLFLKLIWIFGQELSARDKNDNGPNL